MLPSGNDGEAPQLTSMRLTPIEVDVDGLKDFRTFLVRELDTNLKPGAQGISSDHSMGAHFGAGNAGARVRAAREHYANSLQASTVNLAEYIKTAEVLIDAIHRVAAKYADADLSSAATASKVDQELAAAFTTVTLERSEAARREREHETQREQNRLRAGANP
jgi:hypothetical protein